MSVEPHCLLKLEYILQGIKQECWNFNSSFFFEGV